MAHKVVSATEFKAKCLALLDEVDEKGGTITVTKRGRPVAVMNRAPAKAWDDLRDSWKGRIKITGEIVHNDWSHLFEALQEPKKSSR